MWLDDFPITANGSYILSLLDNEFKLAFSAILVLICCIMAGHTHFGRAHASLMSVAMVAIEI